MKDAIAFALAGLVIVGFLARCTGCLPREAKEAMADSSYAAEQLRCVDQNDTKPKIDACRASVRLRWGIAETVTDGGAK